MRIAQFFWPLLFSVLASSLPAQNYVLSNDVPVTVSGRVLSAAWAGGLTAPQLSSIDLNGDGRLDLVVFERDGGWVLPFLNGGTTGEIDYQFAPSYASSFPTGLTDWMLLRDFDGDGLEDIFTAVEVVSNVRVYRNTSQLTGGSLSFALYQDTVQTSYPPDLALYSSKSDLPAIDDVDGDGDLDLLTFQLGGNRVEWHRNTSVETTGGLGGMVFDRQSRCFGHFEEDALGCTPLLNRVPCGPGERSNSGSMESHEALLHAGSTLLSLDLDSNGLKDLIIGDIGCGTLYALYNGGTSQIAHFSSADLTFPSNSQPAQVLFFPAAYVLDLNNDGKNDLAIAPNKLDQVEDERSIEWFSNAGTNGLPIFVQEGYGILQDEMIDIGTGAMPTFFDYNGDGLQDLLVGGVGRYDSLVSYHPRLALYANTGTAQQPAFTLITKDYLGLRNHPAFTSAKELRPTAADLDADGDLDLLLGNADGTLFHFQNTAGPGNIANFTLLSSNYAGIDAGISSAPQLVDLDGDGDNDLLVGNHRGYVQYYRNNGTPAVASFGLVTDSLGQVKVNNFSGATASNGYAQPFACDYDMDGDMDLLVGGVEGQVQVYENISLIPNATFQRAADLFGKDFGSNASVTAVVLDSAKLSFIVGDHRGGLSLYRDHGPVGAEPATPKPALECTLFPNPAGAQLHYQIGGKGIRAGSIQLYDLLGAMRLSATFSGHEGTLDVSALPAGMYLVMIQCKEGKASQRIVVAH